MKKDRRWLWIILGIVLILLVGWIAVRWINRDLVPVKVAAIVKGPIEAVISASGIVDAPVYDLGTPLGGKIASLKVKEGDRVKKGDFLLEFIDTSYVLAPENGIVAKINYEEGETVVPGSPAIIVVNYAKSWVGAQIDEIDIANVKVGDKVKVTSDVYPDKVFDGQIYWIAPLAELRKVGGRVKMDEESYVFPCKIRFLGAHDELKVNMSVNVDIVTDKKEDALLVPREALVSKDDTSTVFAVKRGRVRQTEIKIGLRSYASVEAVSGASEGDLVAISNISKLKDKGRVKIER